MTTAKFRSASSESCWLKGRKLFWQEFGTEEIWGDGKYVDSEKGKRNSSPTSTARFSSGKTPNFAESQSKMKDLSWTISGYLSVLKGGVL